MCTADPPGLREHTAVCPDIRAAPRDSVVTNFRGASPRKNRWISGLSAESQGINVRHAPVGAPAFLRQTDGFRPDEPSQVESHPTAPAERPYAPVGPAVGGLQGHTSTRPARFTEPRPAAVQNQFMPPPRVVSGHDPVKFWVGLPAEPAGVDAPDSNSAAIDAFEATGRARNHVAAHHHPGGQPEACSRKSQPPSLRPGSERAPPTLLMRPMSSATSTQATPILESPTPCGNQRSPSWMMPPHE